MGLAQLAHPLAADAFAAAHGGNPITLTLSLALTITLTRTLILTHRRQMLVPLPKEAQRAPLQLGSQVPLRAILG